MSFNDKNFWMSKDAGCLIDGKVCLGAASQEEQKRRHHWDAPGEEFLSSKKQAAQSIDNRPIPRTANMSISLWCNSSSSGSGQFNYPDFVPDPMRTIDLAGKDFSSSCTGHLNIPSGGLLGQFENDSAVNLSMCQTQEPLCLNGDIGKGSVTGNSNSMNAFSMSIEHPHDITCNNKILSCSTNQTNTTNAFQPSYGEKDHNSISLGPSFNKVNDNFILMGQALGKGGGEFMLKGQQYHRVNDNVLSIFQPFDKGSCGFVPLDQQYGDSNNNFIPDDPVYSMEHENFLMMGASYGKLSENFKSIAPTFDRRDASTISMGITFDPGHSNILSMGQNYDVGESTVISFGTDANSSSSGVISGSDILINQSSVQVTEATPRDASSKKYGVSMGKEQKKGTANNFPANVKSMLSTGIFDGVPVKYVSWSREKSLRGVIRGSGYLCGCDDCKFSKVLNAYEFERHAGCKTKHPNNHIYFENGKTVYSVVQELKSTTQEVLFEVIQSVTGSPINLKNFRAWTASYQAASRELERIYGKDETVVLS